MIAKQAVYGLYVVKLAKIDKMMMSDLALTLIQKKLLRRLPHKTDKRAYSLILTDKGNKLVLKAIPVVEGIDKEFFNEKTSEVVQLVHNLRHLVPTEIE